MTNKEVEALMVDTDKLDVSLEEKVAIKEKQFQVAMDDGNVQMLIWLGKQHLGQKELPEFSKDELCEGFDLEVIDFAECDNKGCKCVDCGKNSIDI